MIGTTLGSYRVIGKLGQGGMGEVYRAHDTKLQREVAIKMLPPAFAADRDRLLRFEREAQSLAALNHPNIAQIYGVLESPSALVMELVDGDDLSARIGHGPIPVKEALTLAVQIADALECAHERGIIHRDLKPANIKINDDGVVKVLDFGLAKAAGVAAQGSGDAGLQNSPTFTSPAMTELGVILGTAAYMAPEQAKGRAVDRRADVWAFGGVLFEMLTGRRAFGGDDVTDVIASIMRGEPEWAALPAETPRNIRKLLRRCLEKDRAKRLDSMAVAKFEIQEALASPESSERPSIAPYGPRVMAAALVAGIVCAIAAAGITWFVMRPREASSPVLRVHLTPPPPDGLSIDAFISDVDVSPDGRAIAYNAGRAGAAPEIFIRHLDQDAGVALPGTTDGRGPLFSADGQWVSFQVAGDIKKVPVNGGPAQVVCTQCTGGYRGGTWLPDGSFVYTNGGGQSGLRIVPPDATTYEQLTQINREANERAHLYPRVLPGARGILFNVNAISGAGHIALLDLRTKTTTIVARGGSNAQYAPSGHLVYAASGTLYAMPFDLERLEATGVAVPALDGVVTKSSGAASYAVASNGTLLYVGGPPVASSYSVSIVRRNGGEEALPVPPGVYVMARFSPDGSQAVLDSRTGDLDLHIWDFSAKQLRRLTFAPSPDQYPVWSPDGGHVVYAAVQSGSFGIWRKNADGTGEPERLTEQDAYLFPTSFTPDGQTLIAHVPIESRTMRRAIYTISMTGDHTPRMIEGLETNPLNAQISPDGKWIAYETARSGRSEVLVHPFPKVGGGRWQVSQNGGAQPVFRGSELFFRDAARRLIALTVQAGPTFRYGNPTVLMENVFTPGPGRQYDVSADGQRFLLIRESRAEQATGRPPQLNVVFNWIADLERLTSAKR